MIGVGVPDIELTFAAGSRARLADLWARGPVVLFFYPKDGTPGCTAEACSFRDAHVSFSAGGAQVIGISSDSPQSHASFAAKYELSYPLASDPAGKARAAFGVPKTLGVMPGRVTYVIDRGGIVRSVVNSMFAPFKHVDTALAALKALQ
jgi:peroxiredoxin Q/BCP